MDSRYFWRILIGIVILGVAIATGLSIFGNTGPSTAKNEQALTNFSNISTITYDGCEYIILQSCDGTFAITHKGNCPNHAR